jgi:hypothetical protein
MGKDDNEVKVVNKELLRKWLTIYMVRAKAADQIDKAMSNIYGSQWFDSPLGEFIGINDDCFIDLLSEASNASIEELNWFVYEAKLGNDPKECRLVDGTEILVNSIETFLQTI